MINVIFVTWKSQYQMNVQILPKIGDEVLICHTDDTIESVVSNIQHHLYVDGENPEHQVMIYLAPMSPPK